MDPVTIDTIAQALHLSYYREGTRLDERQAAKAWSLLGPAEIDAWRAAAREAVRLHEAGVFGTGWGIGMSDDVKLMDELIELRALLRRAESILGLHMDVKSEGGIRQRIRDALKSPRFAVDPADEVRTCEAVLSVDPIDRICGRPVVGVTEAGCRVCARCADGFIREGFWVRSVEGD